MSDGNRCGCCGIWYPYPENMEMVLVEHDKWGQYFVCDECVVHLNEDERIVPW